MCSSFRDDDAGWASGRLLSLFDLFAHSRFRSTSP
jgi:hypothetical protein